MDNSGYKAFHYVDDQNYDWSDEPGYDSNLHAIVKTVHPNIFPNDSSETVVDFDKDQVVVKDGEKYLVQGKDYDIISSDKENIKLKFKGNYSGEKNISISVKNDKSNWGKYVNNNGIANYVSSNGTTSVEITGNDIFWLKEESGGTYAWYGIDNSKGTFKKGSKFWVRWINNVENPDEWKKYYNYLDDFHKNKVENQKIWIFLTGVTDPDGKEYTNLNDTINYYVQISDDWQKNDINAIFISSQTDEILDVSYETISFPEGQDEFACIKIKHFSPYAIYDENDNVNCQNNNNKLSFSYNSNIGDNNAPRLQTGDHSINNQRDLLLCSSLLAIYFLLFKIKLNQKLN